MSNTKTNIKQHHTDIKNIPKHVDVICIGGGLIGMTMANALAGAGVSVVVVDKMPLDTQISHVYDGRASAIATGSVHLFEYLDIWHTLIPHANPIESIQVQEKHPVRGVSPLGLTFQGNNTEQAFGYVVENNRIRGVLADKALSHISSGKNLHYLAPARVGSIDVNQHHSQVSLTINDTDTVHITCALVLGCDGKFSQSRQMMGIKTTSLDYKQHAIVCTIQHEQPHNNVAIEQFMPAGPFAILPMTDNRSNIVWSCRPEHTSAYMNLSDNDFKSELAHHLGDWTGDFEIMGQRYSYPFSLLHAYDYTAPRFALIGDAAHGMHAIAGQGFNLGLRDVAVMAEIIIDAMGIGQDIGNTMTLANYARWRRFDIITLETITNGLNALFSNDNATLRLGRNTGLALLDKTHIPKHLLTKHAMGKLGPHIPRLLQKQ